MDAEVDRWEYTVVLLFRRLFQLALLGRLHALDSGLYALQLPWIDALLLARICLVRSSLVVYEALDRTDQILTRNHYIADPAQNPRGRSRQQSSRCSQLTQCPQLLTQREPMTDEIAAFKKFDRRQPGWIKVGLLPQGGRPHQQRPHPAGAGTGT